MRLILFVLLWSFGSEAVFSQQWVAKTGLPGNNARNHPVSWALGGLGYSITGATQSDESTNDFFRYNPTSDTWEQLPDFPGPKRNFSIGGTYQGKGYLGFGSNESALLNDLWRYNPQTATWEELAACPCSGREHPSFTINEENGKIYAGLGNDATANLKDWWEYDIATNSWTKRPDFPGSERHHPFQFSINGYSYTGLGHDDGADMARKDFYRYNPADSTWISRADAPGPRIAGTQFSYGGRGYVLSGEGHHHMPSIPSIFWKYDPASNSWQALNPHPEGSLWAPGSFIIDGILYLFGGVNRQPTTESYFKDMWAYDLKDPTTINDNRLANEIHTQLSPNPATGALTIKIAPPASVQYLNVFDINGRLVYRQNTAVKDGIVVINTEKFLAGMYYVEMIDQKGKRQASKFIKE